MTNRRIDQGLDDIEEGLSRWVGDVASHQIGRVLRGAAGWGEKAAEIFASNVREYLQEESRDLVTRTEADEFSLGVNAVHDAVDQLAERIQRLQSFPRE